MISVPPQSNRYESPDSISQSSSDELEDDKRPANLPPYLQWSLLDRPEHRHQMPGLDGVEEPSKKELYALSPKSFIANAIRSGQ